MKKNITLLSLLLLACIFVIFIVVQMKSNSHSNQTDQIEKKLKQLEYIQKIVENETVKWDIRYSTTDNFMHKDVYGDFSACYLHKYAKTKFAKAIQFLQEKKIGYKFLIFDCLRPRSIQRILYKYVKGTPEQKYVANPDKGSIHNYGFAIDLSLLDNKGNEVDMGTEYDNFTELAEPTKEKYLLQKNKLTKKQLENRLLLREVMEKAGFKVLDHEWWHFDALDGKSVRQNYTIVE